MNNTDSKAILQSNKEIHSENCEPLRWRLIFKIANG